MRLQDENKPRCFTGTLHQASFSSNITNINVCTTDTEVMMLSAISIVQQHPYFSLLNSWERNLVIQLLTQLNKKCELVYSKVSDLSDITLINMRFQCPPELVIPQYLSLVEISKERHYTQLKYFFTGKFATIRLVLYKPSKFAIFPIASVNLELYIISQ